MDQKILFLVLIGFGLVGLAGGSANPLEVVSQVGDTVHQAWRLYEKIVDEVFAKLFVNITNYSNITLSLPEHYVSSGELSDIPQTVSPGYEEAMVAIQKADDETRIEGVTAWTTRNRHFCFIYYRVPHGVAKRNPNALGVGCTTTANASVMVHKIIAEGSVSKSTERMSYHDYGDYQPIIQFCNDFLCVQATMTTSHKSIATVDFIPRKTSGLAKQFRGNITQDDLDKILNTENLGKTVFSGSEALKPVSVPATMLVGCSFLHIINIL